MSYCRFENTSKDLADCYEYLNDPLTGEHELRGRARILKLCRKIVDEAVPNEELPTEKEFYPEEDES